MLDWWQHPENKFRIEDIMERMYGKYIDEFEPSSYDSIHAVQPIIDFEMSIGL